MKQTRCLCIRLFRMKLIKLKETLRRGVLELMISKDQRATTKGNDAKSQSLLLFFLLLFSLSLFFSFLSFSSPLFSLSLLINSLLGSPILSSRSTPSLFLVLCLICFFHLLARPTSARIVVGKAAAARDRVDPEVSLSSIATAALWVKSDDADGVEERVVAVLVLESIVSSSSLRPNSTEKWKTRSPYIQTEMNLSSDRKTSAFSFLERARTLSNLRWDALHSDRCGSSAFRNLPSVPSW